MPGQGIDENFLLIAYEEKHTPLLWHDTNSAHA